MNELELLKERLNQLSVIAEKAFKWQLESCRSAIHPCKETTEAYRKADEDFYSAIDEMRKLIVKE